MLNDAEVLTNEVTTNLREGATLTLDLYREVHEPIRSLAEIIESVLCSRVHVVVFAGWHSTQAFSTHWDPDDIFVLQTVGRKHWRVLEPTRRHPTIEDRKLKLKIPEEPYWEGDLSSGDLLHIPRGWWHDATPYSEPSLHLTFVVKPATGVELAEEIISNIKDLDFIRANLPRYATESEQLDYMEAFRSALNAAASGTSLTKFLARYDSMMIPARARISLPWSAAPQSQALSESAQLEWCPIHPCTIVESDENVTLETLGSTFTFQRFLKPILVDLVEQRSMTFRNLRERHPTLDASDCVMQLISTGLLALVESDDSYSTVRCGLLP